MTPRRLLIVDVETSGVDPAKDHLVEVGLVRWSVEHRSLIAAASWVVRAPSNDAENINGIPTALLADGQAKEVVLDAARRWAGGCDLAVAHNLDFDRQWLGDLGPAWCDSAWDISWPRAAGGRKLIDLALAHGLAVLDAHRALSDCLLLARLLERVGELGTDVSELLARAMRPKVVVEARGLPFERKDEAKTRGFRWNDKTRVWWRRMFAEEVAELPFRTVTVAEQR